LPAARRGLAVACGAVVLVVGITAWYLVSANRPGTPGCTVTAAGTSPGPAEQFSLTTEQAQNAATIAAVGLRLGMPAHAVTVALATAMQESKLRNLAGGDRDSAGLFQQRPSEGWGSYAQVTDPIHAATSFYDRLRAQSGWAGLSVTEAAQLVQHSGAPDAYAQWESEARALAAALSGETAGALSCHDLVLSGPGTDVAATAAAELGTTTLTGTHSTARGWAIAGWLVANAARFAVDQVTFDGRTWTIGSATWSVTGAADGVLSFHRVAASPPASSDS
jgi:hypothetical protein